MSDLLHVIDETTPPDALMRLCLLFRPADRIVAFGPLQAEQLLPASPVRVHCPLKAARLAGWRLRHEAAGAEAIHAWSPRALEAAIACPTAGPVALSISVVPRGRSLKRLIGRLRRGLPCAVPTRADRERLLAAGAPEAAVHIIPPPATPIDDTASRRRRGREALGLDDNTVLLTAPGPLVRDGGARNAMWAHGICRHAGNPVHLAIPRGGPLEPHVRYFATTAAFGEEIHFTDRRLGVEDTLAAADVALLLPRADVGVSAAAEALAAGLSIVASDLPQLAEYVRNEREGLLGPAGDVRAAAAAVLRLMEDADLAARLRESAAAAGRRNHDPTACRRMLEDLHAETRQDRSRA